ncbi:MAG: histidinol-phosphate transaminase [Candidatus Kapaibacteriales bacterium]
MVSIPDYIQTLKPYKSGNKLEGGMTRQQFSELVNLASNENPLGSSPMALEKLAESLDKISVYPDPGASELVSAIAEYHDTDTERIITGSGSDSLIQYIVNAFMQPGESLMTSDCTFIGTYVNVNKFGFGLHLVPHKGFGFNLEGMLAAIDDTTKIIYIANPNNPTGTMITEDELLDFLNKVPSNIIVVVDEAYYTYASIHEGYPDCSKLEQDNLIVLRTLSKTMGLAGIRLGYAIGNPELIGYMYRVKLPFEPNILAQSAGIGALNDKQFADITVSINSAALQILENALSNQNIKFVEGKANFTMALFESEEQASEFVKHSLSRGFVVRQLQMFGIPNGVRISTGTIEQTEKFCETVINTFN